MVAAKLIFKISGHHLYLISYYIPAKIFTSKTSRSHNLEGYKQLIQTIQFVLRDRRPGDAACANGNLNIDNFHWDLDLNTVNDTSMSFKKSIMVEFAQLELLQKNFIENEFNNILDVSHQTTNILNRHFEISNISPFKTARYHPPIGVSFHLPNHFQ